MNSPTNDFNETMGNPEKFNDCTCDAWPTGEPHRHVGAMRDDGSPGAPPTPPVFTGIKRTERDFGDPFIGNVFDA